MIVILVVVRIGNVVLVIKSVVLRNPLSIGGVAVDVAVPNGGGNAVSSAKSPNIDHPINGVNISTPNRGILAQTKAVLPTRSSHQTRKPQTTLTQTKTKKGRRITGE